MKRLEPCPHTLRDGRDLLGPDGHPIERIYARARHHSAESALHPKDLSDQRVSASEPSYHLLSTDCADFHRFKAFHLWQSVFICGPMLLSRVRSLNHIGYAMHLDQIQPLMRKMPAWLSAAIVGGIFIGLVVWEWQRPLRKKTSEPKLRRNIRNMAVAGTSAATVMLIGAPVSSPLTKWVHRKDWGLVKWLRLPPWLEVLLALVLLDYSLYLWHVAFHKVPCLWRFHQVHHVDLDMDASTAIRFHFGEMAISTGLQTFQILTIGVSPLTFSIWNTWLISEVIFHHSNVELPFAVERWLCKIIVTPRMHGIHHSLVPEELNSNWSSGLTLWDRLHGTLLLNVPQNHLTLGAAAYPDPREVTYPKLLEMPFDEQRYPPWVRADGTIPHRDEGQTPTATILAPETAPDLPADSSATRRT